VRIYAAISGPDKSIAEARYPWLLAAYPTGVLGLVQRLGYRPEGMMLDSGAYSAWTRKLAIDVEAYAAWAISLLDRPPADDLLFLNLDVIPGRKGGAAPGHAEIREAMLRSDENAEALRSTGVPVVEVYHQGEPPARLEQLVARAGPNGVVGISPRKDTSHQAREAFVDAVFHQSITAWTPEAERDNLYPGGKVPRTVPRFHGLGVSRERTMRRYPWYSCDSTTWMVPRRYGEKINRQGRQERMWPRGEPAPQREVIASIEERKILTRWAYIMESMGEVRARRGLRFT
jgi:hypothetical protein